MVRPIDIALKISDLQDEVYQLHDAYCAPNDDANIRNGKIGLRTRLERVRMWISSLRMLLTILTK